jgi:hypothetical protein
MITSKGADVERLLIPGRIYTQGDIHATADQKSVNLSAIAGAPLAMRVAARRL